MQYEIHVNYKDTGRDSEDAQSALFTFAADLLEPLGVECKAEYKGLGELVFQVTTIRFYRIRNWWRRFSKPIRYMFIRSD